MIIVCGKCGKGVEDKEAFITEVPYIKDVASSHYMLCKECHDKVVKDGY